MSKTRPWWYWFLPDHWFGVCHHPVCKPDYKQSANPAKTPVSSGWYDYSAWKGPTCAFCGKSNINSKEPLACERDWCVQKARETYLMWDD